MNETSIRTAIQHALQYRGYWPFHHQDARPCPKCHTIITPPIKGRPDIESRHPKFPTVLIEVKDCKELAFPFAEIEPEQRAYLTAWMEAGGASYLALGKIVPMGSKTTIHSIYVVLWDDWLEFERYSGGKSAVYDFALYQNKVRIDEKSIVDNFSSRYRLFGASNNWHFQDEHSLAVQPEVQTPFFLSRNANSPADPRKKEKQNATP